MIMSGGEGGRHSEETKRKMSAVKKGEKNHMYGWRMAGGCE